PEPITRIVAEFGYSDSNYFSRAFNAETGLTPKAYLHQVRAPAPMSPTHQDFAQTSNTSPPSPEGRG
ncbi:MAG: helix-turn-helix transcriptional regulator, partial [Ruminococcus sp.]|nr:helix-turn-helix transcriptional regulator [Ruminococcus sp.]